MSNLKYVCDIVRIRRGSGNPMGDRDSASTLTRAINHYAEQGWMLDTITPMEPWHYGPEDSHAFVLTFYKG